jgi:rRNA-processing protein FCF1
MPSGLRYRFMETLAHQFNLLEERYIASKQGTSEPIFRKLGLTDTIIGQAAKNNYLVLTDDFPLTNYLESIGVDAINFNHLRFIS